MAAIGDAHRLTPCSRWLLDGLAVLFAAGLALLASGCLPDRQHTQAAGLLDQLVAAHGAVARQGDPVDEACRVGAAASTRLYGEPGLRDLGQSWLALQRSTEALAAACGQLQLAQLPARDGSAVQRARARWQAGAKRQLARMCADLRLAATSLGRPAPACEP